MEAGKNVSREGYLNENYHYFHLRDTAGQERDYHFHDFSKIVILLSGRVNYTLENVTYHLRPWDILLVKHHTIHKAVIDKSQTYDRVIIYLDGSYSERTLPGSKLMDCFAMADEQNRHLLTPNKQTRQQLSEALLRMEQALSDKGFGAQAMRDTILLQILVLIGRAGISAASQTRPEKTNDPKIASTLTYINDHLTQQLPVEDLAERVFLSKYHFMRLFKLETGTTVHAYIRQKRLLNAARLIREGAPAAKAAAESGFGDYSAFHRAFRETFGTSPGMLKR